LCRRYLANLNIPIYGNYTKYMFYDVLVTLAHQACELQYLEEHKNAIDNEGFDTEVAKPILDKDNRIELLLNLKTKSSAIGKKHYA